MSGGLLGCSPSQILRQGFSRKLGNHQFRQAGITGVRIHVLVFREYQGYNLILAHQGLCGLAGSSSRFIVFLLRNSVLSLCWILLSAHGLVLGRLLSPPPALLKISSTRLCILADEGSSICRFPGDSSVKSFLLLLSLVFRPDACNTPSQQRTLG